MSRPSWNQIWMDLAKAISKRSTCKTPDRQVGCVIIDAANSRVLSIGYNGGARGDDNVCDYVPDDVAHSRCTCIHAEMNALAKLSYNDPCEKTMYITLSPCIICAKLIVNAGITKVVYLYEYRDRSGIFKLRELGIECTEILLPC